MKSVQKTTFAVLFGNRGFFPGFLQKNARKEIRAALEKLGYKALMLDEKTTRYGAVETPKDGRIFAEFLKQHQGEFGGVILCLPNFGDETGAVEALKNADVPILIQAYPDELDKMAPNLRRDAFCGKFSIMDVFYQSGLKYTALKPHTVHPENSDFSKNIDYFDRLCRVVNGMREMVVGAIGARTTAFKTVRIDELALQRCGITMETIDLSDVFHRMKKVDSKSADSRNKAKILESYTCWKDVPGNAFKKLVCLGVVLDQLVEEYRMDAIAVRCWLEMQQQLGISPCVVLSEMNNRGVVAACEVDVGSAVTMHALYLASGNAATCLDWNNNYGEEDNKCILFHCGVAPQSMMTGPGLVTDHVILANAVGPNCSWGCNTGRIAQTAFSFGSMMTDSGKLKCYLGEGRFTSDPIPDEFFGCAGVAEINNMQNVLQTIGLQGYRHHVSLSPGNITAPLKEALEKYLGIDVITV